MNPIQQLIGEAEEDFSEYEDILALDSEQEKTLFNRVPVTTPEEAYNEAFRLDKGNVPEWIEKLIATSAEYSLNYALHFLGTRFALGEPAIATNARYSLYYACDVLEKGDCVPGSYRFPLGEPAISKSAHYAYVYANEVLVSGDFVPGSKRFPAGEPAIFRDLEYAAAYTRDIGLE